MPLSSVNFACDPRFLRMVKPKDKGGKWRILENSSFVISLNDLIVGDKAAAYSFPDNIEPMEV